MDMNAFVVRNFWWSPFTAAAAGRRSWQVLFHQLQRGVSRLPRLAAAVPPF
ncbi:hypothetical protein ACNKHW_20030 [Shigella flexneri]